MDNVRVRVGDLRRIELSRASFDTVLLLNVLVEIDEPQAVLGQLAEVLGPAAAWSA